MKNKRDCIVDQACHLFLTKGYDGVSVQDICNSAGLTKGALYHHFLSKDDLFRAVVERYSSIQIMRAEQHCESLRDYILFKIEKARALADNATNTNYVPLSYLSLMLDALRHYPEIREQKEQIFNSEYNCVKGILNEAILKEEIRNDINVDAIALTLLSITLGIAASFMHTNSYQLSVKNFETQLNELYKLLVK